LTRVPLFALLLKSRISSLAPTAQARSSPGNNSGLEIIPVSPLKRARRGVKNLRFRLLEKF
jgi:hypothetical protein